MSFTKPSKNILIIGHVTNKVINFKWRKCNNFFKPLIKENIKYTTSLNFLLFFINSFCFEKLYFATPYLKSTSRYLYEHTVHPLPPFLVWEVEPPTKFSKSGSLTGSQFSMGCSCERWGRGLSFSRHGYSFYIKTN